MPFSLKLTGFGSPVVLIKVIFQNRYSDLKTCIYFLNGGLFPKNTDR